MAVLVNEHSASASELLAACLQDHHRAVIVGQRSYGKGTVQEIVQLPPGYGAVKVTVADYWRPSGKDINRPHHPEDSGDGAAKPEPDGDWGVMPDSGYEVLWTPSSASGLPAGGSTSTSTPRSRTNSPPATPPRSPKPPGILDVDPQLAKAVEYIRGSCRALGAMPTSAWACREPGAVRRAAVPAAC